MSTVLGAGHLGHRHHHGAGHDDGDGLVQRLALPGEELRVPGDPVGHLLLRDILEPGWPVTPREQPGQVPVVDAGVQVSPRSGQEQLHGVGHPGVAGLAHGPAGPVGLVAVQLIEQGEVELGLPGVVVVEAADAGAGPGHDVRHPGLGVALADENLAGRRQETAAGGRAPLGGTGAAGVARPGIRAGGRGRIGVCGHAVPRFPSGEPEPRSGQPTDQIHRIPPWPTDRKGSSHDRDSGAGQSGAGTPGPRP